MERFDADAVRRILRRADSPDGSGDARGDVAEHATDDLAGGVGAEALVVAAAEVGYSPDRVRASIALERFGEPSGSNGLLDRAAGRGEVSIQALVEQPVGAVLDTATAWLERAHRMSCRRVDEHTLVARRRAGLGASVGRRLTDLRGDGRLGRARSVTVSVAPSAPGAPAAGAPETARTLVRLTADRRAQRQRRVAAGGMLTATGAATAAVGVAEAMFAWPVAAVVLGGAGVMTVASGRGHADRVEHELDDLLDAIRRATPPTGTLRKVARAARRSVSN